MSRATLERAIAAGDLVPTERRAGSADAFALEAVAAWLRRREEDARGSVDDEASKSRKLAAEARLRELDLAEREAGLVSADDVETRWTHNVGVLNNALQAVPPNAVQAGLVARSDELKLRALINDALVTVRDAILRAAGTTAEEVEQWRQRRR